MKNVLFVMLAACGGPSASTSTATAPAAATATAPATATATATDNSPPSIGNRHDKVGNGWFISGSGKEFYEAIPEPGADPRVVLKPKSDAGGRWVTLMKNVGAAPYIGQKVRIRVGVKSQGVTGKGELWARTARPHTPEDAPTTTAKIDPTSEMKPYEVTIDVPQGARVIEYGVSLAGDGQVWVGHDSIDAVQ